MMFNQNSVFIRQTLYKFLPSDIIGRVTCFVFYDHHPKDERSLDITVCSDKGEVIEYYQRELVSSILIDNVEITEIKILRSSKCELFYLVATQDEITIVSTKEKLQIHKRVSNVESFKIDDVECKGYACLSITRKDDAVSLVFDENFDNLTDKKWEINVEKSEESLPIITQLTRKLTEAKYATLHNEEKYKELLQLRQAAAFAIYKKINFNTENPVCEFGLKQVYSLLQVESESPIIKLCNKKIVIIINIQNNNNRPMKNVCVLLHSTSKQCIDYTTKLFEPISETHWKEKDFIIHKRSTVVAIIDLKELQYDIMSGIHFEIVLCYASSESNHLLPIKSVSLSALNIMDENFDILYCPVIDSKYFLLCIMATSEYFELRLRHIRNVNDNPKDVTPSDIFHKYLKMEKYLDNVAINKLPSHMLYGTMIIYNNTGESNVMNVQVYTRFPSQVLALVQYMHDAVPFTIIVTPSNYTITAINDSMAGYSETKNQLNHMACALSILDQTKLIKEYTEECRLKMLEDTSEMSDVDDKIDLIALGMPRYLEFRSKLLDENLKGLERLYIHEDKVSDVDCMIID